MASTTPQKLIHAASTTWITLQGVHHAHLLHHLSYSKWFTPDCLHDITYSNHYTAPQTAPQRHKLL
eukprot:2766114-Pyramimonas_sp.AAC.1